MWDCLHCWKIKNQTQIPTSNKYAGLISVAKACWMLKENMNYWIAIRGFSHIFKIPECIRVVQSLFYWSVGYIENTNAEKSNSCWTALWLIWGCWVVYWRINFRQYKLYCPNISVMLYGIATCFKIALIWPNVKCIMAQYVVYWAKLD